MTAIQEVTKPSYDFRNQNGAGVWLPPNISGGLNNLKRIDPYESTAEQLYPVGSLGYLDQRKFAYAYSSGGLAGWARLVADTNLLSYHSDNPFGNDTCENEPYAAALIDATVVDIADQNARVKNYYQGGYLVLFHIDGTLTTTIRIAASDLGNGSTHVRLYLDDPLPWALSTTFYCSAFRNPYSNLADSTNSGYETFMGLSLCAVTATHYSWVQIAGPCWLAPSGVGNPPGGDRYTRDCYAHLNGTVTINPNSTTMQYIGYVLGEHPSGSSGDTYMMLLIG